MARHQIKQVVEEIHRLCTEKSNKKHAKLMEGYFKHQVRCHGIKSPGIRSIVKQVQQHYQVDKTWTAKDLLQVSSELIAKPFLEEQSAGVYFLQPKKCLQTLVRDPYSITALGTIFDQEIVTNWATCDGLSSGVIRKLIEKNADLAPVVQTWSKSPLIWKKRASCVAFVCLAKHGEHNDRIIEIVSTCILSNERFVQLGAGWVLRELSTIDQPRVIQYIKDHYFSFSREGLRYAIEKMPTPERKLLLNYGKANATNPVSAASTEAEENPKQSKRRRK